MMMIIICVEAEKSHWIYPLLLMRSTILKLQILTRIIRLSIL